MISILSFTGVLGLLFTFGYYVASMVLPCKNKILLATLALPLSSVINVIVVVLLSEIGIPLSLGSITISFVIVGVLLRLLFFRKIEAMVLENQEPSYIFGSVNSALAIGILSIAFVYGFAHAVLLPTFHYDSATNWNMRSKIAFTNQTLSFLDENNLIRKPHYPPLYHSLQITAMQGQSAWREPIANGIHFLLSLSVFASLFLCLGLIRGTKFSLVVTALIAGIPLLSVHLGQGYADITLIQFTLLSLITYLCFMEKGSLRWLTLSSIFVGACVLTKSEGLPFCFVPWSVMILCNLRQSSLGIRNIFISILPAIALTVFWVCIVTLNGLPISPHGNSDLHLSVDMRNFNEIFSAMFSGGSFGVTWFVVLLLMPAVWKSNCASKETAIWGVLSLAGLLMVYGLTGNNVYLLSGQSFDRQMLLPACLLTLSSFVSLIPARQTTTA